jgi:carbamoylphosphate synthase large subunit
VRGFTGRGSRLLLTSCGGAAGVTALTLLKSGLPDLTLIGADADEYAYAQELVDDFFVLPATADLDAYCESLVELARTALPNAIVPCHSTELGAFGRVGPTLMAGGVRWPVIGSSGIATMSDKFLLYSRLQDSGVAVPDFSLLGRPLAGADPLAVPRVLKPRRGAGGRGVRFVSAGDPDPCLEGFAEEEYVQQVWVEGPEISLDGVVLSDGRVVGPVSRARRSVRDGLAVVSDAIDLAGTGSELFRRVAAICGARGALNVQVFRIGDSLLVTDVNPRFPAGGLAVSAALGLNLPKVLAIDLLVGPSEIKTVAPVFRPVRHYKTYRDVIVEGWRG